MLGSSYSARVDREGAAFMGELNIGIESRKQLLYCTKSLI